MIRANTLLSGTLEQVGVGLLQVALNTAVQDTPSSECDTPRISDHTEKPTGAQVFPGLMDIRLTFLGRAGSAFCGSRPC